MVGLTSFGSGCAKPGFPDVFINIAQYKVSKLGSITLLLTHPSPTLFLCPSCPSHPQHCRSYEFWITCFYTYKKSCPFVDFRKCIQFWKLAIVFRISVSVQLKNRPINKSGGDHLCIQVMDSNVNVNMNFQIYQTRSSNFPMSRLLLLIVSNSWNLRFNLVLFLRFWRIVIFAISWFLGNLRILI